MTTKHLRLVYSKDKEDARNPAKWQDAEWTQLELFPGKGKSNSVIFVNPIDATFGELLENINLLRPKNIIDIREITNLNFYDISREKFFQILENYNVHYLNFHKYMSLFHTNTIQKVFDSLELKELESISREIEQSIKKLIEDGPTLVFTDTLPSDDLHVSKFTKTLKRSNTEFSPYLCIDSNHM